MIPGPPAVLELSTPGDLFQHLPDLHRRERLGDVIHRSGAHGFNRVFNRGVSGENDHVQVRICLQEFGKQIHPVLSVQPEVQKGGVEMGRLHFPQRHLAVFRAGCFVAHPFQRHRGGFADICFVVNNQHSHTNKSQSPAGLVERNNKNNREKHFVNHSTVMFRRALPAPVKRRKGGKCAHFQTRGYQSNWRGSDQSNFDFTLS